MWSDPFLWVLPGIAILCIVVSACRLRRSLHRVALHSLAATVIIALVFIGTGSLIAKKYPYKVAPEAGGDAARIAVRNGSAISSGKAWEIWIDSAVFGPYWGRTLRNIINDDQPGEIVVHAPWSSAKAQDMPQAQTSICAGFQAELFLNGKQQFGRAILLHPAMFPAEQDTHASNYDKITVCLPKTDVSEYNYPWRLWAKRHNARLLFSPGSAARIEPGENTTFWRELFFDE